MTAPVWYGTALPTDHELRLCGDVAGKRCLELGISPAHNAVVLAAAGAKALAVDPRQEEIAAGRRAAERAEVRVEYHQGELAELGFATSTSIDVVVAAGTLHGVDDLARVLRQVHRVLKPEAPFVVSLPHPIVGMLDEHRRVVRAYGTMPHRSVAELFMAFQRSNFRVDVVHELSGHGEDATVPSSLLVRARKLGV
jgi:SAM-dependent methyltransferase